MVLCSRCCPGNSWCFATPVIFPRFEESSSGSCLESMHSLLCREEKHSLQRRPQSLFSSPLLSLLCPLPESAIHLPSQLSLLPIFLPPLCPLPHLILDRSNCQSGVEDFKQGAEIHTHKHTHTSTYLVVLILSTYPFLSLHQIFKATGFFSPQSIKSGK